MGSACGRSRGHIRRRGNSFQVLVYAEIDSLTITGMPWAPAEARTRRANRPAIRILDTGADFDPTMMLIRTGIQGLLEKPEKAEKDDA